MRLQKYKKKRDFTKTPEPKGKISHTNHYLFVIQKHAASHLHYDFRLELNGVLLSWAIPKGPCLDPNIKRLAIHVEDHPVSYGHFEGIIPQHEYGGGTVMLWDKGIWKPLNKNPQAAYKKGHLSFELDAEKLHGKWHLFRFKDDKHWLLVKEADAFSQALSKIDITKKFPNSVMSDQSIEEIAQHAKNVWRNKKSNALLPVSLKPTPMPKFISPQLATLVNKPPEEKQWVHEIKYDGYRILAFIKDNKITLKSRNNKTWTDALTPIVNALKQLTIKNAIFDGEIVLLNRSGNSDFQLLQNTISDNQMNVAFIYYIFDMVYYDQYDLMTLPLIERKTLLKHVLKNHHPALRYSEHVSKKGEAFFQLCCKQGIEGIVSKDINSPYFTHRSKSWLKIKCHRRQEFIIGGYSSPKGNRNFFGALYLGVYNKNGTLDYTGNVGTGFTRQSLKEIYQALKRHETDENPFNTQPPKSSTVQWIAPVLVAEIEFMNWTKDGRLRHPSFKGLRLDKKAADVTREKPLAVKKIDAKKKINTASILLTHPNKILYPEDGITKQDLLAYYESVANFIMPFLKNRPLSLVRCPQDYNKCFFQRHYNRTTPKTLLPITIADKENELTEYFYLKDISGLFSLAQMGVLEIHPWGSHVKHLEKPDMIVFDLDPAPDVPWQEVVAAASEIKNHLARYELISFVKSTGGKGLHIVIPIKPEYNWEEVKKFTHVFVQFLEQLNPQRYISTLSKSKRKGKIFVDYLRNQKGATAIGAYSTRARIHAPVSMPLAWEELTNDRRDTFFTIKNAANRLNTLSQDPWHAFWTIKQSLRKFKIR